MDDKILNVHLTWNDYPADYRVAELVDGKEIPYPSMEWNKEFVCVQSVVADDENHLWRYPVSNPYSRIAGQGIDGISPRKSTISWKTVKNMPFIAWTLMNENDVLKEMSCLLPKFFYINMQRVKRMNAIFTRTSVRSYEERPIEQNKLKRY